MHSVKLLMMLSLYTTKILYSYLKLQESTSTMNQPKTSKIKWSSSSRSQQLMDSRNDITLLQHLISGTRACNFLDFMMIDRSIIQYENIITIIMADLLR